jgi:poly-gamma-glutamate synthesis protein (capsule biosynthesis protein)
LVSSTAPAELVPRAAAHRAAARSGPGPTLALGGDVLYDAPLAYQLRRRAREVGRPAAYREVFADLAPSLRAADLSLVNLEVPVAPRYRSRDPVEDTPVFRAPEDFLDALRHAGVDAVTVANNHAYDQGRRGLGDTLRAAARRNLRTVGAGDDARQAARPVTVEARGARVALAAWTEGTNHRPRRGEGPRPRIAFLRDGTVAESLRLARARADLVVAAFHWTQEDLTRPRPVMRRAARDAAEAGADLVIGHGTHVPGRTEQLVTADGRRVTVLYSLGNLLAAMEQPAGRLDSRAVGVRDAPLALVRTRWREGRLEVADVEVRHHWIARPINRAPWLDGGRLAVSRPVRIDAELRRLSAADCGRPCAFRAAAYRRRVGLVDAAMARLDRSARVPALATPGPGEPRGRATPQRPTGEPTPPRAEAPALATAGPGEPPAGAAPQRRARESSPRRAEAREPSPRPDDAGHARRRRVETGERGPRRTRARADASRRGRARAERAAAEPPSGGASGAQARRARARRRARLRRARPRPPLTADDPRLRPYLRGVTLPIEFHEGAALERSVDEAAIRRVVALLRADRSLRVEVIGHASAAEAAERPGLGRRRARRVKGLIAIRGPSRSRFRVRGGAPGRPRVVIRLTSPTLGAAR